MTQSEATELLELFRRDHANVPEIDRRKLAAVYVSVLKLAERRRDKFLVAGQPLPPEPADEKASCRTVCLTSLRREPDKIAHAAWA